MPRARAVAVGVGLAALAVAAAAWASTAFTAVYVGGGSMSPALIRGDLAVVRKGVAGVRTGQIVLVEKPGWPAGVLHRVVAVDVDGRLQLRGDANPVADLDPVTPGSVSGIVAFVLPTGRALAVLEGLVRMVQSRVT
jgi:signal peptidase I